MQSTSLQSTIASCVVGGPIYKYSSRSRGRGALPLRWILRMTHAHATRAYFPRSRSRGRGCGCYALLSCGAHFVPEPARRSGLARLGLGLGVSSTRAPPLIRTGKTMLRVERLWLYAYTSSYIETRTRGTRVVMRTGADPAGGCGSSEAAAPKQQKTKNAQLSSAKQKEEQRNACVR